MDILEYLKPLRRWWWLLVLGTLVATSAAFIALRQQPPMYQSRTALMIGRTITDPNPNYGDIYLVEQLANTYADLAQRAPVRKAAMARLGIDWLPSYSVQLVPDTQLLEIVVTDTDPALAQAAAVALAEELVAQSPTEGNSALRQRQAFVQAQLDELEAGITDTREEVTRIQGSLASMLSAREIADAQAQISALRSKLSDLQANYAALLSNTQQGASNTLTVVEPAELPTDPTGTSAVRTLALVAAIGLMLSAGTAYLLSYLDDTLKTPEDVKRSLGLTALAAVPDVGDTSDGQELVMLSPDHSAASEAYRVLRTNLQFTAVDHVLRTLMVTSPAPSEGKSLSTANLALAFAQAGRRVILVDADLHRPRLHRVFGLPNAEGLTTALLEENGVIDRLLQATSDPRLRLLSAGPLPPNPTELLATTRMRDLLGHLVGLADIVLIDTPPVLILADAAELSTLVDGVLLVVGCGGTRRGGAERAVETLRGVNARLVGVLINRVPIRGADSYYYYSYYEGYGYSRKGRRKSSGILARLGIEGWLAARLGAPRPRRHRQGANADVAAEAAVATAARERADSAVESEAGVAGAALQTEVTSAGG